jgi:hypothetical protein
MQGGKCLRKDRQRWRATCERAACALLVAAACAPLPLAAQAAIGNAPARTTVLPPFTVGPGADLDFGQITSAGPAGTVVLPANGANTSASCTTTGGLVHAGACRAARFDGDASWFFPLQVTKPAGNQLILTGPLGATMVVNNLTYGGTTGLFPLGSTATTQSYLVTAFSGEFTLHVGGRLNVGVNQRPGIYTGTFALTFNYN